MSAEALTWAFRQHSLRPPERFVLVTLADRANQEGVCWPGYGDLAYRTGYTVRRVQQLMGTLVRSGLVEKVEREGQRGQRRSNLYVLHLERGTGMAEIGRRVERVARFNASLPRDPSCEQPGGNPVDFENEGGRNFRGGGEKISPPDGPEISELDKMSQPEISPLESSESPSLVETIRSTVEDRPVDNKESASRPTASKGAPCGAPGVRQGSEARAVGRAYLDRIRHRIGGAT